MAKEKLYADIDAEAKKKLLTSKDLNAGKGLDLAALRGLAGD